MAAVSLIVFGSLGYWLMPPTARPSGETGSANQSPMAKQGETPSQPTMLAVIPLAELRPPEPATSTRLSRRSPATVAMRFETVAIRIERRSPETQFSGLRKTRAITRIDRRKAGNLPAAPAPRQPTNGVIPFRLRAVTGYIIFEGKTYKNGFTPPLSKKPGAYKATVVPFDDTTCCKQRTVTFRVSEKALGRPILLSPAYRDATLVVRGTPGAVIQVGGKSGTANAPITIRMHQPTSSVVVSVSKPGYAPRRLRTRLKAGQKSVVPIALSLEAPNAP
jgi:hypothetical protein